MTVGDRIRKRREDIGMSQTDLAKKVNISKQTLYKYEMNIVTNIPSDKIELIGENLKISPAYLMGWSEQYPEDKITIFNYLLKSTDWICKWSEKDYAYIFINHKLSVKITVDEYTEFINTVETFFKTHLHKLLLKAYIKRCDTDMEIAEETNASLPKRFTDIEAAKEYLHSEKSLAALCFEKDSLHDVDYIYLANKLYRDRNTHNQ